MLAVVFCVADHSAVSVYLLVSVSFGVTVKVTSWRESDFDSRMAETIEIDSLESVEIPRVNWKEPFPSSVFSVETKIESGTASVLSSDIETLAVPEYFTGVVPEVKP